MEFTPTGFMGVGTDLISISYSKSYYEIADTSISNIPTYITSFVYIDSKLWMLKTYGYGSYSGTSTLINYLRYTLASNFDQSYNPKTHTVDISENIVTISSDSSKINTFFLQGQGDNKYWTVVYWN